MIFPTLALFINDENLINKILTNTKILERIKRRALRLRIWSKLSTIERYIMNIVIKILYRIKSKVLLSKIVDIVKKIVLEPIYTEHERRIIIYMKNIRLNLLKLAHEVGDENLLILSNDPEYLWSQAIKTRAFKEMLDDNVKKDVNC